MRILYFTAQDSPHDQRFLQALAGTTHEVFSLRMFTCQPETLAGIREFTWHEGQPDWSCWQGWQAGKTQLIHILDSIQPDILHAGPIQGPASLAAMAGFHPLLSMSWGSDLMRTAKRSPWMRINTQFTLEHTDILLVDCQTVARAAADFGFPPEQMVRFPWGVDLAHFSPQHATNPGLVLKRSLGWEDRFVILCNRSWSPPYGVELLAQAFVYANQENQNLRLLLGGDGPQSDLIRQILAPIKEAVYFPGWVDFQDLPRFYGAADLFVSPSRSDGSSISLLEALACGRPVLVSDIPSNREWVTPGEVGGWFTDGDASALKDQLLAMSVDSKLADYGSNARLLAEERADWGVNFQKLLDAYQAALAIDA